MNTILDKTDVELKTDILAELAYEPSVAVTDLAVFVHEGGVTLRGYASRLCHKEAAVIAAKRVAGVRAITDQISLRVPEANRLADLELARAVVHQLGLLSQLRPGGVTVQVRDGWVSLGGAVEWCYLKLQAQQAIQVMPAVRGITNLIEIKPLQVACHLQRTIENALARSAVVNADYIQVEATDNRVRLHGKVRHYAEREEAERIAWAAAGVWTVDNHIDVEWFWGFDD